MPVAAAVHPAKTPADPDLHSLVYFDFQAPATATVAISYPDERILALRTRPLPDRPWWCWESTPTRLAGLIAGSPVLAGT